MALKFDVGFSEDENLKWRKSMEVSACRHTAASVHDIPSQQASLAAIGGTFLGRLMQGQELVPGGLQPARSGSGVMDPQGMCWFWRWLRSGGPLRWLAT